MCCVRSWKTGETDSTVMVAIARPTVGTKINESEERNVDIESESEVSKIMSLHDSSDKMENFHLGDCFTWNWLQLI